MICGIGRLGDELLEPLPSGLETVTQLRPEIGLAWKKLSRYGCLADHIAGRDGPSSTTPRTIASTYPASAGARGSESIRATATPTVVALNHERGELRCFGEGGGFGLHQRARP